MKETERFPRTWNLQPSGPFVQDPKGALDPVINHEDRSARAEPNPSKKAVGKVLRTTGTCMLKKNCHVITNQIPIFKDQIDKMRLNHENLHDAIQNQNFVSVDQAHFPFGEG